MKKILIAVGIVLVLIQFFRPEKNISQQVSANAIENHHAVPVAVRSSLQTSCYDCHSNNTTYPWYNNVQPLAWWFNEHVKDGKRHLNFDEFNGYSPDKKLEKLEEIVETIEENEMPLSSYTFIHTNARLTLQQKKEISDWVNTVKSNL